MIASYNADGKCLNTLSYCHCHTQILEMLLHLKTSFISPESYNTVSCTKTIIRLLTIWEGLKKILPGTG